MKQLIRKKTVSAALVGLASGVIVNTVNMANAHAASTTTDNTVSTSGTTRSKNVLYVDEQGNIVGSGKITETAKSDGNGGSVFTYAVDKTIPAGYSLKSTSALTGYPDKLTVVKSKTTTNTSASEETAMASAPTTPQSTTKITTSNNGSSQSNTNASGNADKSNTTDIDSKENTKTVSYVGESGKVLGTGKLTKKTTLDAKGVVHVQCTTDKTIPAGYKLRKDSDMVPMPDKLTLIKGTSTTPTSASFTYAISATISAPTASSNDGTSTSTNGQTATTTNDQNAGTSASTSAFSSSTSNGSASATASTSNTTASQSNGVSTVNGANSKTVTYVDDKGNTIGTGTISKTPSKDGKTVYAVDKSIPAGYALKNNTDLSNYPDKLTLVKDAASTDTSFASIIDGKSIDDNKDADNDAESEKEKEEEKAEREGTSSDPEEVDATGGDEDGEATNSGSQKSKKGNDDNTPASSTTTTSASSPTSTDSGSSSSSSVLPATGNEKDNAVLAAGTFATGASLLATVLKRRMRSEDK